MLACAQGAQPNERAFLIHLTRCGNLLLAIFTNTRAAPLAFSGKAPPRMLAAFAVGILCGARSEVWHFR